MVFFRTQGGRPPLGAPLHVGSARDVAIKKYSLYVAYLQLTRTDDSKPLQLSWHINCHGETFEAQGLLAMQSSHAYLVFRNRTGGV